MTEDENNKGLEALIKSVQKDKTEIDLLQEILINLKSINYSNADINKSNEKIKGWVTFMGVLLIIQIVAGLIIFFAF